MAKLNNIYEVSMVAGISKKTLGNYVEAMQHVCTLETTEELSYVLRHTKDFTDMNSVNINFFKKGVNASWEHPDNLNGCSWTVNISPEMADVLFQRICVYVSMIGFKRFKCNGIKVNIRKGHVKFEVWSADIPSVLESSEVLEDLHKALGLEFQVGFQYKNHKEQLEKAGDVQA